MHKVLAPYLLALFLGLMPLRMSAQILMSGTCSYSIANSVATYGVDRIENFRSIFSVSGTLAIQLWATSTPFNGGTLSGYKLTDSSIGTLPGGYYFSNVVRVQTVNPPPRGYYYMVFVVAEWNGSAYVIVDYRNFQTVEAIGVPPFIVTQPRSYSLSVGQGVSLTVSAAGSAPFSYQWQKNGTNVGTGDTLNFGSVQISDTGSYTVIVSNSYGAVTSAAANLTVTAVSPAITSNPASQTRSTGTSVSFSVVASGTAPFTYQWRKSGVSIGGAVDSSYSISSVQISDAGSYMVDVSNQAGSVTSGVAILTVATAPIQSPLYARTNGFSLKFSTQIGIAYRVQASTNFLQWTDIAGFVGTGSTMSIPDTAATNLARRFYRVVSP